MMNSVYSQKSSNIERVFLITVDCLRADHVGCIGGGELTPNIDKLAEDSIVFTRAFANGPGTNQSFPAIFTSTYFLMHGGMRLLPQYPTIAEVLRDHGFKTVGFHSNPFLSKTLGWDRGFDEFYDFMDFIKSPSAAITRSSSSALIIKYLNKFSKLFNTKSMQSLLRKFYYRWSDFEIPYTDGDNLNKHVFNWIERNNNHNFFLWMHYMDPHRPYIPPSNYLDTFTSRKDAFMFDASIDQKISQGTVSNEELKILKGLYEGEIKYVDNCIGKLINNLNEQNLLKDSLLILAADHGEAFMEHNKLTHPYDIAYNEVLHVPIIIYGFNDFPYIDNNFVQLMNVSPTILDALKIKKPNSFYGNNLIKNIKEKQVIGYIISESAKPDLINLKYDTHKKVISCIFDNWKLIINDLLGTKELYDIKNDFSEQYNIINERKDIAKKLLTIITNHKTNTIIHNL